MKPRTLYRWVGFSEDDGRRIAEGANISPESFRGCVANALRTTRSTWCPLPRYFLTGADVGSGENVERPLVLLWLWE